MRNVPINEWGRDHWSMLAYVESRCVDNKGVLDLKHVRCNQRRHPGLALPQHVRGTVDGVYQYSTRLRGGAEPEHDDWDCFYDLEAAKLVEDIGTGANPMAKLTTLGKQLAAQIRRHKANGGNFASFATPDLSL